MDKEYNGIHWKDSYPDEKLMESIKFYSHFYRDCERKLSNDRQKEQFLTRIYLKNMSQ